MARKFFSATVALPADAATSVLALMQASISAWGGVGDSVLGMGLSLAPDATVYVGHNSSVRATDATPLYKGVEVTNTETYNLQGFWGPSGAVDPSNVFLYAAAGANVAMVFQGG